MNYSKSKAILSELVEESAIVIEEVRKRWNSLLPEADDDLTQKTERREIFEGYGTRHIWGCCFNKFGGTRANGVIPSHSQAIKAG